MKLVSKLSRHLCRLRLARRFGVSFTRRAAFSMPKQVRLSGRMVELSFPAEAGVANDFLTCLIEDSYGLSRVRGPIQTIVDIGGNVGFFSLAASSWFPEAAIHIYEPNPRILPHLQANASAVDARVFPEAVGAIEGLVKLEDCGDSNQARTVPAAPGGGIPQVSLATVLGRCGGGIDLAKIDCEGAEWEMLTVSEPWERIRRVRMEYHLGRNHSVDELRRRFAELNFKILSQEDSGPTWGTIWCDSCSAVA